MLQSIQKCESPLQKIQVLDRCSDLVQESIKNFWADYDVPSKNLVLAIDEYLSIFVYIIVQAGVPDLEAHLLLIETFLSDFTLYTAKVG
jgi:hypothetical protein